VQSDHLGSEHVGSGLDVAWDLQLEAVVVVGGDFVGPFICGCQLYVFSSDQVCLGSTVLPLAASNPFS
jgi:hypothetical protein